MRRDPRCCARDGTRYSYIVWIDAETKLPMRVDLLDRDGETLEQFRVISFNVGDNSQVGNSMQNLAKASLPPCFPCLPGDSSQFQLGTILDPARVQRSFQQPSPAPTIETSG